MGIVRNAVNGALHANGTGRYGAAAALTVTELIAVAGRLTCDAVVEAASLCFVRRRRALWLLAEVVDDCGGEWG
ncbi:hypothetical protein [Streptomyces sp. NPDC048442]|uniref:hypothetical protein n=1 Tax=Streptomyces sp. NPDC048442 TaxID=3154823 RepID=UPI00341CA42B